MLNLIVATSENGVIGCNNEIPWYLPIDLQHFKSITTGHTVIMGRKTYESIFKRLGKSLPHRNNIVITRQENFQAPGCIVVHSWQEAVEASIDAEQVFVIGGAEIYNSALPYVEKIYLTIVHTHIDGDAFFTFTKDEWTKVLSEFHPADEKNEYACTFLEYTRK